MLRWHSQHSYIKLRDIAGLTADRKITEILADLTSPAAAATTHVGIGQRDPEDNDERLSA